MVPLRASLVGQIAAYLFVFSAIVAPLAARVDPTFVSPLTTATTAVAIQDDGKTIVGSRMTFQVDGRTQFGFARLNFDGSVDATFKVSGLVDERGSVDRVLVLPDGKLMIQGSYLRIDNAAVNARTIVRLNNDGSLDRSFQPAVRGGHIILLAGGRYLHAELNQNVLTLTRYNLDNLADSAYVPAHVTLAPPQQLQFTSDPRFTQVTTTRADDGRTFVAISSYQVFGTAVSSIDTSRLFTLAVDGTVSSGIAVLQSEPISQLIVANDKLYYVAQHRVLPIAPIWWWKVGRLNLDFTPDSTYSSPGNRMVSSPPAIELLPDGSALVTIIGASARSAANILTSAQTIALFDRNGTRDLDYRCEFFTQFDFERPTSVDLLQPAILGRLLSLSDGRVLVTGSFGALDDRRTSYLGRVAPSRASASRLSNFSLRQISSDRQPPILGFVINGRATRKILVRGVGPSLATLGIVAPMADPRLSFFENTSLRLTNDNWADDSADGSEIASRSSAVGAFSLPPGSRDSAAIITLGNGAYTLVVDSLTGSAGATLLECYDTDAAPTDQYAARVVNFSGRGIAGGYDAPLVVGFTVLGTGPKRLLVRAAGPAVAKFGIAGLIDPVIKLYSGEMEIGSNDDWIDNPEMHGVVQSTGAFAFESGSKDAALLVTLPAGAYSIHVTNANNIGGMALVEVYEVR
jgi:hypothetical protein